MTDEVKSGRFDALIDRAAEYQEMARDNYDRVRRIAQGIESGFCAYLSASDGKCVQLVPPAGPFQPKNYGDEAFSMPPRGFRHIAPIAFGLAVRVTRDTDWMRMVLMCSKEGENFVVSIADGSSHTFDLPFGDDDHQEFYDLLYDHIMGWLKDRMAFYRHGNYGTSSIGFDFNDETEPGDGIAPEIPVFGAKTIVRADTTSETS